VLDRQLARSGLDGTWSMVVILSSKIYSTETAHKPHVAERAATMLSPQCHPWQFAITGWRAGIRRARFRASAFLSPCGSSVSKDETASRRSSRSGTGSVAVFGKGLDCWAGRGQLRREWTVHFSSSLRLLLDENRNAVRSVSLASQQLRGNFGVSSDIL
jgi:hypothetical protein